LNPPCLPRAPAHDQGAERHLDTLAWHGEPRDIDAQTVSGAISTGTHGNRGRPWGIATQVAGLELVLADGTVVSCSATRTRLFAAARVSVGALACFNGDPAVRSGLHAGADERPMALDEVLARFVEFAAGRPLRVLLVPLRQEALVKRNNRTLRGTPPRTPGCAPDGKAAIVSGARKGAVPRPSPRWRRSSSTSVDGERGVRRALPDRTSGARDDQALNRLAAATYVEAVVLGAGRMRSS